MKQLTEYLGAGRHFTLVARKGNYAVFKGTTKSGIIGKTTLYECIEIQVSPFEPRECRPPSSQWGLKGWTKFGEKEALEWLDEMEKKHALDVRDGLE